MTVTSSTPVTPPTSAVRSLLALQCREFVRNYSYFVFVVAFPFFMLGMFLGMQAILSSTSPEGGPGFDQTAVPMATFLGVTGVALTSTAGPLAEYRQHGTLRVLGTTPLSRSAFILSHLAVRLVFALLLAVAITVVGALLGAVGWATMGRLVPAVLGGLAIYLGLGYLLGGLVSSGQLATNIGTLVQVLSLFMAGVAIPFSLLPSGLADVLSWLPTSQFGDLLLWAVDSPLQHHAWWISLLYACGFGCVLLLLSVLTFRWDTRER